jgi:hypothetical protein
MRLFFMPGRQANHAGVSARVRLCNAMKGGRAPLHNPIIDKVYKGKRWQKCRAAYYALRMATDGAVCEYAKRH